MKTTIGKIKSFNPCKEGWKTLISFHGEDFEKELSPMEILKSNGIKDAVWSLKAFDDQNKVRLFAADIAESVLYIFENQYPNDDRPRKAIEAARKFANGEISESEMRIAGNVAYDAACAAARAARAARDARDAAYAAYAAARDAACDAVDDTVDAACTAACAAARDAVDAACDAACAAVNAARDAAYDAARLKKWQEIESILIKYFEN